MSCIHITSFQLACSPCALPAQAFQLNKASACTSTYLGTKLPKISLKLSSATSKYRQSSTVCLFGGKGKSENGNEASPWNALEKAMGNFKKDTSIEDVLKQQIQKQEYYDGDGGGKPPGGGGSGGGGGGGGSFGEAEGESLSGMWDEFFQVIMGTAGFIFLYMYFIEGEEVNVIVKDVLKFIFKRQKSIRLSRLINQWSRFFQSMKEKEYYDPNWLEREIINSPTWYDHPAKYRYILKALDSLDSVSSRSDDYNNDGDDYNNNNDDDDDE